MPFNYSFRSFDFQSVTDVDKDLMEARDLSLELYLRQLCPSGSMSAFAGSTAPAGWLICDGSVVSQTTYADLYATIGTTYNTGGEGAGNFRLPNIKGRVIVGQDTSQTEFDALGETGGAKTHTLTTTEMPVHSHTASTDTTGSHTHTATDFPNNATQTYQSGTDRFGRNSVANGQTTSTAGSHTHTVTVGNAGSGGAHNNLQPYIALNWIIKT